MYFYVCAFLCMMYRHLPGSSSRYVAWPPGHQERRKRTGGKENEKRKTKGWMRKENRNVKIHMDGNSEEIWTKSKGEV